LCLAQEKPAFENPEQVYQKGVEFYEKEKFGIARQHFEQTIDLYPAQNRTIYKVNAEFYLALCAIELFHADAEYLITSFIAKYPESPKAKRAYFEMAKFRYRQQEYREAIKWFEKISVSDLDRQDGAEYHFKLGYAYFMEKNTKMAAREFFKIKDKKTRYTSPAIYYYAHVAYENGNYETALTGFLRLSDDKTFAPVVPYYITQIYYYQEKYEKVIDYATGFIESASTKRKPEIAKIIGEAYFRLGKYQDALAYLEMFDEEARQKSRYDKYQLAYTHYKLKNYEKASEMFEVVTGPDDELGQNTYYHLADCYLQLDDKNKARLAFSAAAKMAHDKGIQEDALFNYAKISLELKYTPFNDAIEAFNRYIQEFPNSFRVDEAYGYLMTAYMNAKNYKEALAALENIKQKDNTIKKAIQRVSYFRGLELFNNLQYNDALAALSTSLEYGWFNQELKALAMYWSGEAHFRLGNFAESARMYEDFTLSPGAFQTKVFNTAHYNLGYCYFKIKNYDKALSWYRKYVNMVPAKPTPSLGDAYNRIGDCYFLARKYWLAIENYDKAISSGSPDADYAQYQRGFALGLVDRPKKKIQSLKVLIDRYPTTTYFDDALFELGKSYTETRQHDMAIEHYKLIVNEFPSSQFVKNALVQLGLLHYNQDRLEEALGFYKRVVTSFPGTPEAKNSLTGTKNIYIELNDVESYFAFVDNLEEDVNISYSEQDSLTYIAAENKYMAGDCETSVKNFEKYLEKFPNGGFTMNAHYYRADCHARLGNLEKALVGYNYIIKRPKNNFSEQALKGAAEVNFLLQNYQEAYNNFRGLEKIAANKQNLVKARVGMMRSSYLLNHHEQVVEAANKVLLSEKIAGEIIRETHFKKGMAFFELSKYNNALSEFRIIADEVSSIEGARSKYMLAEIYSLQEQYDPAEQEIKDFIAMNTPHVFWMGKAFILLADIYTNTGENFKAKATLQSLIDNYSVPDDGIIDEANEKLLALIKQEKEQQFSDEQEEIKLNFEENETGEYNELFKETKEKNDTTSSESNENKNIE
jgi:tetratricopeptide (TPR) repeat protein